ncbi:MAG: methyltransferase domain-containing protein [Chloroflexota bacterium]|nr:MAG: methyltransferase domain-containing protein [Chloroflexota bacterium]
MRYRKVGREQTTRKLIAAVSRNGIEGMTLLDIGGGVGGIQHTLLEDGVVNATSVDASSAYVKAAQEEASRRGLEDRITFLHGDFVDLAEELPQADIVTLDRVVCCYDNLKALVKLSAMKARKRYGLVFPRDLRLFRMLLPVANFFITLTGSPFRIFIHSTEQVEKILKEQGLVKQYHQKAGFWQIIVYNRV